MNNSMNKIIDFLIALVIMIFLTFIALMHLSGGKSFEKPIYDKQEDKPTMEEVEALLNEVTDVINLPKVESSIKKPGSVAKAYKYIDIDKVSKEEFYKALNLEGKWQRHSGKKILNGFSEIYCYNQFELNLGNEYINESDISREDLYVGVKWWR